MNLATGLTYLGFKANIDFICQDDGSGAYVKAWLSTKPKPSDAEIEQAIVDAQTNYASKEYQRDRAIEYPSIGDQLDALFHAGVFPEEMAAKIQAVKDKYPKEST